MPEHLHPHEHPTDAPPPAALHDQNIREGELLTVAAVLAELGGVPRRTFYKWRALGKAPRCLRLPNGELRIRRSDLTAWMAGLQETDSAGSEAA